MWTKRTFQVSSNNLQVESHLKKITLVKPQSRNPPAKKLWRHTVRVSHNPQGQLSLSYASSTQHTITSTYPLCVQDLFSKRKTFKMPTMWLSDSQSTFVLVLFWLLELAIGSQEDSLRNAPAAMEDAGDGIVEILANRRVI